MLDRSAPPPFVKQHKFDLIKPEIRTLRGGNEILFIHGGEQDVIKLELVFSAGKWYEPKPGVAYFTAHLLPKGTSKHNSFQVSSTLDFYGIHIEINPGFDFTSVSLYGLTKNFPPVLSLLLEILSDALFPETELQQLKNIYTQSLRINLEKTSYLASCQFRKCLFGSNHPYGQDADIVDIELLTTDQLVSYRENCFNNFTAIASGRLSTEIMNLISDQLGILSKVESKIPTYSKAPGSDQNVYSEKQATVQSSIRIGNLTIGRTHQDYPALLLLNHILGGFFGSRLMKNIREEKGLTYGIHSSIHALKHDTYFVIGADVNKDKRIMAVDEIKKELLNLIEQQIPDKEIETAQNHFIGSLMSELSTPFAHAEKIKSLRLFNLSDSYYQNLIDSISTVNKDQLQKTAGKYLADFYTVSVG